MEVRAMEQNTSSNEHAKIKIYEVQDLRYWTQRLKVSSDELVSAVRAVGSDSELVQKYLRIH
jgi:hypothetical protein